LRKQWETGEKIITSAENPRIKRAQKLKTRKGRDREGLFLLEGKKLLLEALKSKFRVEDIFILDDGVNRNELTELDAYGIKPTLVPAHIFKLLTETETPQGFLATVAKPEAQLPKSGSLVVLDRLQDPGNVGTMIRSADAAGFAGVIFVKGTVDPFAGKTVRAAAGAILRLPFYFAEDEAAVFSIVNAAGIRSFACTMFAEKSYTEADLRGDIALIVGNEGGGISQDFLAGAAERIYIPMREQSESLNAAVAGSIFMFEKRRQDVG
jgi:TrmH family RNA methyltransferase